MGSPSSLGPSLGRNPLLDLLAGSGVGHILLSWAAHIELVNLSQELLGHGGVRGGGIISHTVQPAMPRQIKSREFTSVALKLEPDSKHQCIKNFQHTILTLTLGTGIVLKRYLAVAVYQRACQTVPSNTQWCHYHSEGTMLPSTSHMVFFPFISVV